MNPFEMVVIIVFLATLGTIVKTAIEAFGRRREAAPDPEAGRLRDEVRALKERVAVLERIATDKNHMLEQEFERLRLE